MILDDAALYRLAPFALPEEHRAVLLARADEAQFKEIAADLAIPLGTSYSRFRRGRAILARALGRSLPARGKSRGKYKKDS